MCVCTRKRWLLNNDESFEISMLLSVPISFLHSTSFNRYIRINPPLVSNIKYMKFYLYLALQQAVWNSSIFIWSFSILFIWIQSHALAWEPCLTTIVVIMKSNRTKYAKILRISTLTNHFSHEKCEKNDERYTQEKKENLKHERSHWKT